MPEFVPVEKLKQMVGQENGLSDWVLIDQDRINRFADVTGQRSWIHVDIERANEGPYGGPIGHGDLTLSLIPLFSTSAKYGPAGVKMAVNYGLNKVRYLNPVPVDARVRSRMVISGVEEKQPGRILMTTTHTVEIEGQEKPACIAETLAMLFF
ncbi:MAG: MaoC family dehydratase [Deltaproteobacteria bacterium]|nr:MaoC family dehydratase [Deltaproteobacteria bacterium]